ncbi:hypothetical protein IW492_05485 [Enterococcus sp. BWB1-3]|uniref:hypothetical protein n=1 Tax=unclassified Enterococcus TaxID=2608891 RepID=UPI001920FBB6|nr:MULTISPECIES: hypothetical protein [unclassified Enterococcus]MBL1228685.1 hypothetical protein [Enterococcus sp. BWB1-3]MCB5952756.1 hypothetical protein [Enterococcus sp. BWT-B8]
MKKFNRILISLVAAILLSAAGEVTSINVLFREPGKKVLYLAGFFKNMMMGIVALF